MSKDKVNFDHNAITYDELVQKVSKGSEEEEAIEHIDSFLAIGAFNLLSNKLEHALENNPKILNYARERLLIIGIALEKLKRFEEIQERAAKDLFSGILGGNEEDIRTMRTSGFLFDEEPRQFEPFSSLEDPISELEEAVEDLKKTAEQAKKRQKKELKDNIEQVKKKQRKHKKIRREQKQGLTASLQDQIKFKNIDGNKPGNKKNQNKHTKKNK